MYVVSTKSFSVATIYLVYPSWVSTSYISVSDVGVIYSIKDFSNIPPEILILVFSVSA